MEHLKYQTGDLFSCEGHGWLSKRIGFFTRSKITHSATFLYVWGVPCIIDSQKDGTNPRPFYGWKYKYNYSYTVWRKPNQIPEKDFAIKAMSLSGLTSYDFILFAIRYPFSILRSWITGKEFFPKRTKNEEHQMICSESAAWMQGIDHPEQYTPKRLDDYCRNNNWIKVNEYRNK